MVQTIRNQQLLGTSEMGHCLLQSWRLYSRNLWVAAGSVVNTKALQAIYHESMQEYYL